MSVDDDKAFEDQIERMRLKNQHILEKFQASEEDRKLAENEGSAIKRDQNVSIRVKADDNPRLRNNPRPNKPRPKSFHDKAHYEDSNQPFIDPRRPLKQTRNTSNTSTSNNGGRFSEDIAYQDYMHFQQVYQHRNHSNTNNYHRPYNRQNSNTNYMDDHNVQKPVHQDFRKFNYQSMRSRNPQKFAQNNYQSFRHSKDNEFYNQQFPNTKYVKENEFYYKTNSQNVKEPFQKYQNSNANQSSKRWSKPKGKPMNNKPVVDGSGDSNKNIKKKSTIIDDEYIDDTLEDLEQYRLKIDMQDFIVIDPESSDPILAMPLTPWTNNDEFDVNKSDGETKYNELSPHLLNNANERAKEYLNLVDQNNIEHTPSVELHEHTKLEETASQDLTDKTNGTNTPGIQTEDSIKNIAEKLSDKLTITSDKNEVESMKENGCENKENEITNSTDVSKKSFTQTENVEHQENNATSKTENKIPIKETVDHNESPVKASNDQNLISGEIAS